MLNASPSSKAPGRCSGAAGMSLFCMLRMRPASTAARKGSRSCSGTYTAYVRSAADLRTYAVLYILQWLRNDAG